MCDTGLCPITASFDAAEKFIGNHADIHEDPAQKLGVIVLNRRCAELVREMYPCPGANLDRNGNIHCPLSAVISDTFVMATYPTGQLLISPDKVAGGETDRTTGQFL
jgi:hypothetical protein